MNGRVGTRAPSPVRGATPGTYETVASAVTPPPAPGSVSSQTTIDKFVTTTIVTPKRQLTPLTTTVQFGTRRLVASLNILFAPGHVGLTGVAIQNAGIQLLPRDQLGQYIYGDSERLDYPMGLYLVGAITVLTVNSDWYPHTVQLTWTINDQAAPI